MVNASAWPIAARSRVRARPARGAAQERLTRGLDVAVVAGEVLVDQLGHGLVADQVLHHPRRAAVVGVERVERRPQALVGILDAAQAPMSGTGFSAAQCAVQAAKSEASSGKWR